MKNLFLRIAYKFYKLKEDMLAYAFLRSSVSKESSEKKLLIVKTDAIGDYILFRNFLKDVRESRNYKNYKIYLLGNSVWKNIFDNLDKKYVDKAIFLDLKSIYSNGNKYRKKFLDELRADYFDTIIYPTYSRNSIIDILISKTNAKEKITFLGDRENMSYLEKSFLDKFYTKLITTKEKFEFNRNKEFFKKLLKKRINLKNPKINIKSKSKNYFVVNPGASVKFKRWSPENFAKVIDYLIERYKSEIYIVGSKTELKLNKKVKSLSEHKHKIKIKNDESLLDLLNLISKSRGVISNET